jgi:hypothetical protein
MEDATMAMERRPAAVRLREDTHGLIELLAHDTGLTRTGVIELAVRDLAKRRGVASALPQMRALPTPQGWRSLRGIAAGLPGGSEEFLRRKMAEKAREDRGGREREA